MTTVFTVLFVCIIRQATVFGQDTTSEGIILSGGGFFTRSVEVFSPQNGSSCFLPSLPDDRAYHAMESLLICGGSGELAKDTCISLQGGEWVTSHNMVERRAGHSSWETEEGVLLIGGGTETGSIHNTSEILPWGGNHGVPAFTMQDPSTGSCVISDLYSDSMVISGGAESYHTVARYGVLGFLEYLPPLIQGRYQHGCGSYLTEDGSQVFLVAGGMDSECYLCGEEGFLSSTEMLLSSSSSWVLTNPLPRAVFTLRGVTSGGRLYMTGGWTSFSQDECSDEVLAWDIEAEEWVEIGRTKQARCMHAVTTIQMDHPAMEHCIEQESMI